MLNSATSISTLTSVTQFCRPVRETVLAHRWGLHQDPSREQKWTLSQVLDKEEIHFSTSPHAPLEDISTEIVELSTFIQSVPHFIHSMSTVLTTVKNVSIRDCRWLIRRFAREYRGVPKSLAAR
jgi:hypothetical protein